MTFDKKSIREFKNQWHDSTFLTCKSFYDAGYKIIYGYEIQFLTVKQFYNVCIWCDLNMTREDWLYMCDFWIFTFEEDAFLFRLTWS